MLFSQGPLGAAGTRRKLRLAAFALFSMMAVVVQSFCATVFDQPVPSFRSILLPWRRSAFIFVAMELIAFAGFLWLFVEAIHPIVCSGP